MEAVADDGIRVWIDNQLVVDKWGATSTDKEGSVMDRQKEAAKAGQIKLKAGQQYAIKVEYFETKQKCQRSSILAVEASAPRGCPTKRTFYFSLYYRRWTKGNVRF